MTLIEELGRRTDPVLTELVQDLRQETNPDWTWNELEAWAREQLERAADELVLLGRERQRLLDGLETILHEPGRSKETVSEMRDAAREALGGGGS